MDEPGSPSPKTLPASWGVMQRICHCLLLPFKTVSAPYRKQRRCFAKVNAIDMFSSLAISTLNYSIPTPPNVLFTWILGAGNHS